MILDILNHFIKVLIYYIFKVNAIELQLVNTKTEKKKKYVLKQFLYSLINI